MTNLNRTVMLIAGCALLALTACSSSRQPALVWPLKNFVGGGNDSIPVGVAFTTGTMTPCVTRGSVTVIGFRFASGSGLHLDGWGSRPNPFAVNRNQQGGITGTVESAGFKSGDAVVSNRCSDLDGGLEFAVQFHRTGAATGWVDGIDVTYRSGPGKKVRTSFWDQGFVLCGNTGKPPDPNLSDLC